MIANQAGATVWKWDQQDPFGSIPPNDDPSGLGAFDFPLRLPGQYYDREAALHYNMMRDYDPGIGRYVESDPVGLAGGINTYVYVLANPLLYTDIRGLRLGGVPSESPEDLLKRGPGRIGNSQAADFWGKYYGIKCAERCKVSGPTWVRMNAMMLCVHEIIPAPVQASPFGGTVVEVCTKTCYEQAPKICGPNACLPGVSDLL
jgi:RHS repeat-associated protein